MTQSASQSSSLKPLATSALAGSLLHFPGTPGATFSSALAVSDFRQKRLICNRLATPGQVHVYSAECTAGERLLARLYTPMLPFAGAAAPAFAIIAQSLPYSADVKRLPFALPAGFSAVVAGPPTDLMQPMEDRLTRVRYFAGPAIDTRTLVGGRCYLVIWSPQNQIGKYMIQIGHQWPMQLSYWLSLPVYWWQLRGWYGLGREQAFWAGAALLLGATAFAFLRRRMQKQANALPD